MFSHPKRAPLNPAAGAGRVHRRLDVWQRCGIAPRHRDFLLGAVKPGKRGVDNFGREPTGDDRLSPGHHWVESKLYRGFRRWARAHIRVGEARVPELDNVLRSRRPNLRVSVAEFVLPEPERRTSHSIGHYQQ